MHFSIQNEIVFVFSAVVLIAVLVSMTTYRNAYRLIDANRRRLFRSADHKRERVSATDQYG